jgi:type I restriction enzyme, S subunit
VNLHQAKLVGEVVQILMGQSPPGSTYNERGDGLPFFQGKAQFGELYPIPDKWCSEPIRIAERGDILVSVRAPVGPTNRTAERCCIGRGLAALRSITPALDQDYLHWFMRLAEPLLVTKGSGSTFQAVGRKEIASLSIPLPPLDEQRRIVGLLDHAADIRRRAGAARAKARAVIPALFLDTFGDPATNPKGWPTARLGALAKLTGGGTPSKANPAFWGGTEDKITEAAMAASPVSLIPAGNVLIVVRGMILAHTVPIRMNGVAVTLNQDMKAIIPIDGITAVFLRWALQSLHGYLLSKVRESAHGTKKLETAVLTEQELMVPPPALQTDFAEKVRRIEALAHALDAAAAKAEALAASLSAEVFWA